MARDATRYGPAISGWRATSGIASSAKHGFRWWTRRNPVLRAFFGWLRIEQRKLRRIQHGPVGERDAAEGRRRYALAHGPAGVVADEAQGEGTAAVVGLAVGGGAVEGEVAEGDGVARLHVPAEDAVLRAVALDVRHRLEPVAGVERRLVESVRAEPPAPAVGARDELRHGLARHAIERNPERAGLDAVDAVIGLIVVPGRGHVGIRLLHQHMLVEEAHGARIHEPRRDRRGRGFEDEAAEFGNPVPVAIIAEMAALARR